MNIESLALRKSIARLESSLNDRLKSLGIGPHETIEKQSSAGPEVREMIQTLLLKRTLLARLCSVGASNAHKLPPHRLAMF